MLIGLSHVATRDERIGDNEMDVVMVFMGRAGREDSRLQLSRGGGYRNG